MWACFESYLNKNKEKIGRLRGPRRRDKNYGLKKEYQNGATACDIQQWLQLSKNKNKLSTLRGARKVNVDRLTTDKKDGVTACDIQQWLQLSKNKNKEKIGRLRGARRGDKNYGLKKEYQNGATACDIQQWLFLMLLVCRNT